MMGIIAFLAVLLAIVFSWIVGEQKNIRLLRIAGALVPLVAVPFAFYAGIVVGHGRAYVAARSATDEFLVAANGALERGDFNEILQETQWLHECSEDIDKHAGSFFFFNMQEARGRLANFKTPGKTSNVTP